MQHPTDDDLILRFYGEQSPAEQARIDAHVRACSSCQSAWVELGETLKMVETAVVPEPDAGFERIMWAKVQQALPARRHQGWTWRQLVPVLSFAAVVIAVVALGYAWWTKTPSQQPPVATQAAVAGDPRERVLLTALDDHFEQTELLLIELMNAPDSGAAGLEFERTAADELVASGRLYRVTAQQIGNHHFAQMLEDLETVLVEVARGPEKVNRKELESLRTRIDDGGLLFKVRAVTSEIRERQQEINTTIEGSL